MAVVEREAADMESVSVSGTEQNPSSSSSATVETPRSKGGWRAVFYIIGNESFERLASMSLIMNLSLYLQTKYNLYGVFLINVVSIWSGCCNILTLLGAYVAEKYLGRYRTLLVGCSASFLGMGMMALTAGIPELRPDSCGPPLQLNCETPTSGHLTFLFVALGFLAIGAGAIRPCSVAFGADQFQVATEKGRKAMQSFYNWWYLSFTATLILALSVVVYIQTKISWVIGLAIPTACLALSIVIFIIGSSTYWIVKPQGSVYSDMAKVVVSAIKKLRRDLKDETKHSFYDPPLKDLHSAPKLPRTMRFRCLDRAAMIIDQTELDPQGNPKSGWTLCSVQKVEELKCLIAIVPVWVSGIGCFLVMDQQATSGILQAIQSNQHVGARFEIPPAWVGLTSMITLSIWIFIYEFVAPKTSIKITGKRCNRFTIAQRMNLGIITSIVTMIWAGFIEMKRRELAIKSGSLISPMSVLLLLPQSAMAGLVEAFAAIAVMELLTSYVPESLRTVGGAIYFLSMSVASYLTSLFVTAVHSLSGRGGRAPWVGEKDLNTARLDYYYYIIAGLSAINFVYFNLFAKKFLEGNAIDNYEKQNKAKDNNVC